MMHMEEAVQKQKSRIQWLTLGDKNTNFFHSSVKVRQVKTTLRMLTADDGRRMEKTEELTFFFW